MSDVTRAALAGVLVCLLHTAAWAVPAASIEGAAQPIPGNVAPVKAEVYNITIELSNTSQTNLGGIDDLAVNVMTASVFLACSGPDCSAAQEFPGDVTFQPQGATGCVAPTDACVTACTQDGVDVNKVNFTLSGCSLGPGETDHVLATIQVVQNNICASPPVCDAMSGNAGAPCDEDADCTGGGSCVPSPFFERADATYTGTAGTCTSGFCTNSRTHSCSTATECTFTDLTGTASGSANLFLQFCGNGVADVPGETCDTNPAGQTPDDAAQCPNCFDNTKNGSLGSNTCRLPGTQDQCTICGDGIIQAGSGETCDGPSFSNANPNDQTCRTDCTFCGDGVIQDGESCDNGVENGPGQPCAATCETTGAVVSLSHVWIRADASRAGDNGSIEVTGSFVTDPPADTLDTASGILIRVSDGLVLDRRFTWGSGECLTASSGQIRCRSADGRRFLVFQPVRSVPAQYLFSCRLWGLDIQAPFEPPVEVVISQGDGIDRAGTIDLCRTLPPGGLHCRSSSIPAV